jgi:hypothetical protein
VSGVRTAALSFARLWLALTAAAEAGVRRTGQSDVPIHRMAFIDRELRLLESLMDCGPACLAASPSTAGGTPFDDDDLDHALLHSEITTRAVFYEVTALVERELRDLLGSRRIQVPPRPPTVEELERHEGAAFGAVLQALEKEFGRPVRDLAGWDQLVNIRRKVNSFKHRGGRVPMREATSFPQFESQSVEEGRQAIRATRDFLSELYKSRRGAVGPSRGAGRSASIS